MERQTKVALGGFRTQILFSPANIRSGDERSETFMFPEVPRVSNPGMQAIPSELLSSCRTSLRLVILLVHQTSHLALLPSPEALKPSHYTVDIHSLLAVKTLLRGTLQLPQYLPAIV